MNHDVDSVTNKKIIDTLAVITNKKIIATLPTEMVESLAQRALKSCTVYVVVVGDTNSAESFYTAGITLIQEDIEFIIIKDIIGEIKVGKYHKEPFRQKYKKYIVNDKISLETMDFEMMRQLVKDTDRHFVKCKWGYSSDWAMYMVNEMTFYS